ncbi:hypothetical protein GF351_05520 [Candidatus Woesearchaeota archaeon]|nr:hypothetical protein [Candidatus Woesearchaeota archaeon]
MVAAQDMIRQVFDEIGVVNIAQTYELYWPFIDFVLFLVIFIGLAQATLGERFKGSGGKAVIIGLGIALSIGMTVWTVGSDWVGDEGFFGRLGIFGAPIILILITVFLFDFFAKKAGASTLWSVSLAYVLTYSGFRWLVPKIFTRLQASIGLPILQAFYIIAIVTFIIETVSWIHRGARSRWGPYRDFSERERGRPERPRSVRHPFGGQEAPAANVPPPLTRRLGSQERKLIDEERTMTKEIGELTRRIVTDLEKAISVINDVLNNRLPRLVPGSVHPEEPKVIQQDLEQVKHLAVDAEKRGKMTEKLEKHITKLEQANERLTREEGKQNVRVQRIENSLRLMRNARNMIETFEHDEEVFKRVIDQAIAQVQGGITDLSRAGLFRDMLHDRALLIARSQLHMIKQFQQSIGTELRAEREEGQAAA